MEDADEEDIWYVKILVPETEIGSIKNYKFSGWDYGIG